MFKHKMTKSEILIRGHYLYHLYFWLYGIVYDLRILGKITNKTIVNKFYDAYPSQNMSYYYLRELIDEIKVKKEDVVVDVGCAWGRLLGYLERKTETKKLIGVEINHDIAEQAKSFFKGTERVEIREGNILDALPEDGTVFILFNPFGRETLRKMVELIEEKVDHAVRIIYIHPTEERVFYGRDRWEMKKSGTLRPRHMGELRYIEYELII